MIDRTHVLDAVRHRYSCRTYDGNAVPREVCEALDAALAHPPLGPFGSYVDLKMIGAAAGDVGLLRRLGTYGFIKDPGLFLGGGVRRPEATGTLEDYGYVMEQAILYATQLGLGTVWLGGTFTRSRFVRALDLAGDEILPAVVAAGNIAQKSRQTDELARASVRADKRLPWDRLFFTADQWPGAAFEVPLERSDAGDYAEVLEMVRRGPSASNKQPWRVVHAAGRWHLYLRRSRGYRLRNSLVGVADMQRLDMGIAMCHFELSARALELDGRWRLEDPGLALPDAVTSYVATWEP